MQVETLISLEMLLWLILTVPLPVSFGFGNSHFRNGEGVELGERGKGDEKNTGDLRHVPQGEWKQMSSWRDDDEDVDFMEGPRVLANKHTVQSEIAKRDEKKMKSKKPVYQKYFAELLVATGVLILLVLFLCWFNFSRKKKRRRARRPETTVNSYVKGVVLDPQEFGNGDQKLLGEMSKGSPPHGHPPQPV